MPVKTLKFISIMSEVKVCFYENELTQTSEVMLDINFILQPTLITQKYRFVYKDITISEAVKNIIMKLFQKQA